MVSPHNITINVTPHDDRVQAQVMPTVQNFQRHLEMLDSRFIGGEHSK